MQRQVVQYFKSRQLMISMVAATGLLFLYACQSNSADLRNPEGKMGLTQAQWKEKLTPMQYHVIWEAGTERPFTGELLENKRTGIYVSAGCEEEVFSSEQKYDSGTGWPSFWAPINEDAVRLQPDNKFGFKRTEVVSAKCGEHLGHVFDDGPQPTGLRYCINSEALKFIEKE